MSDPIAREIVAAVDEMRFRAWEERTRHPRQVIIATMRTAPTGAAVEVVMEDLVRAFRESRMPFIGDIYGGPCPWCAGSKRVLGSHDPCSGCTPTSIFDPTHQDNLWCDRPTNVGGWSVDDPPYYESCGECPSCALESDLAGWNEYWVGLAERLRAEPGRSSLPAPREPCDESQAYPFRDPRCDGSCAAERTEDEWAAYVRQKLQQRADEWEDSRDLREEEQRERDGGY